MGTPEEMRRFWDERAREDAYFFIDNRLQYRYPDVERFWARGERVMRPGTQFCHVLARKRSG